MTEFSKLFLYVPGVFIFLIGSGRVRSWLHMLRQGGSSQGKVLSCNHIVKKDKKNREVYNFYDVLVEVTDPGSGHKMKKNIKSPTEYAVSQPVRVTEDAAGKPVLADAEEEALFHPVVTMLGGALLILLALAQNQGKEIQAMACLSILMAGAGAALLYRFTSLKKRNYQKIEAEITGTYTRQISKETKIIRGSRFTYYPIVKYTWNGQEYLRRCHVNASSEKTFQTGDKLALFVDPASGIVREGRENPAMIVGGAVLLVCGVLAGASILSQILL